MQLSTIETNLPKCTSALYWQNQKLFSLLASFQAVSFFFFFFQIGTLNVFPISFLLRLNDCIIRILPLVRRGGHGGGLSIYFLLNTVESWVPQAMEAARRNSQAGGGWKEELGPDEREGLGGLATLPGPNQGTGSSTQAMEAARRHSQAGGGQMATT